jgi:hypothetical protein
MIAAAACALLALAQAPGTAPAPVPPPAPDRPAHGEGSNPDVDRRDASRAAREEELVSDLVPRPISPEAIRAMALELGAAKGPSEAIDALIAQYDSQAAKEHARAMLQVRGRLGAGYRAAVATGTLDQVPGPELSALLEASAAWRRTLAAADDSLLRRIALMRTTDATRCAGVLAYERAVERDDVPAWDAGAALRLPDLLDEARIAPDERRRIEDALEKHWAAIAGAIAARRAVIAEADLERARLQESWGPAWQLTATEQLSDERLRQLDKVSARERATEVPLRDANRAAAAALLRMLAPEAADRVRDAADRTLWPWLFEAERSLADAVARVTADAGAAYGDPLAAMLHELDVRLAATRRELGKRASRAEELGTIVAAAESGAPASELVPLLEAQVRLHELLLRRLRLVTDAAVRMQQACAADPRAKSLLDERVDSARARSRAIAWEMRGIASRLAELNAPIPEGVPIPEEPAPGVPAGR